MNETLRYYWRPATVAVQGTEAFMVEGQLGQPPSAVLDEGLRAHPLRYMPELPSGGRTATQDHPTILG